MFKYEEKKREKEQKFVCVTGEIIRLRKYRKFEQMDEFICTV